MTDSVFRTAPSEPTEPTEPTVQTTDLDTATSSKVSVPDLFVSYEEDQGKPYTADYFELEHTWKQPELRREIEEINGYIKEQVSKGKVDNSTKAVAAYLKEMERKAGLTRYESTNNRITKILAYIDFQKVVHG